MTEARQETVKAILVGTREITPSNSEAFWYQQYRLIIVIMIIVTVRPRHDCRWLPLDIIVEVELVDRWRPAGISHPTGFYR